jgi:hypothetical protein
MSLPPEKSSALMFWGGDYHYASNDLRESLRLFTDKMTGHVQREFRYRAFAAHVLKQLEGLKNVVPPPTGELLDKAVEAWKVELEEIGKL